MTCGIYTIIHIPTCTVYVGSSINIEQRWISHVNRLRARKHGNAKLQNFWNKFPESEFLFQIVDVIDDAELLLTEQVWIDQYMAVGKMGFNILPTAGKTVGVKRSALTKKRLSIAGIGNKRGIGNTANLGRKLPPEVCAKMSASRMGNKNALGNKNHLGHKHNEETRRKISQAQKGKPKPRASLSMERAA